MSYPVFWWRPPPDYGNISGFMDNAEHEIAEFLASFDEEIRDFTQELRTFLRNELSPAYELVGKSAHSFNIGYGFTETSWDCFCAIIVCSNKINVCLPSGAAIPDPNGVMHGSGTQVRHITIAAVADIESQPAIEILHSARDIALSHLQSEPPPTSSEVQTIIKTPKHH